MHTAPVILFVYNRLDHTRKTVAALAQNALAAESDLIVFSDGPKNRNASGPVQDVRNFIRTISGFKSVRIVEREQNFGLARSIIDGVTQVCGQRGRVIVLEDDLVTSPHFLHFMNEALEVYKDDERISGIHGYWYPVDTPAPETFFLRGASCWGWATWSHAWNRFEPDGKVLLEELQRKDLTRQFDLEGSIPYTHLLKEQIAGRNNSWAIRWHASMYLANRLQLSPGRSLVRNIGFDGTGMHSPASAAFYTELATEPVAVRRIEPEESQEARAALIRFYHQRTWRPNIFIRIFRRLRRMTGL